ncbi:HAD family hydrolase [Candidatus Bathyarchaeota archaeon]|nr:HAD family hydrolase [Candidatus Bathyarchaeota archaeon]
MIKAVIFDYGGTLAFPQTPWRKISEHAAERLSIEGIDIAAEDLDKAIHDTNEWRYALREERKEVDTHDFFNHALGILGYSVSRDITDELALLVYEMSEQRWVTGLDKLLQSLSRDYKIALLSNAWTDIPRRALRDMDHGRWFDAMVCSCDIGIPKPDPRIFQHTLNLLQTEASEAVMVGDSIEADIEGAVEAGLQAVWVDNEGTGRWKGHTVKTIAELPALLKSF